MLSMHLITKVNREKKKVSKTSSYNSSRCTRVTMDPKANEKINELQYQNYAAPPQKCYILKKEFAIHSCPHIPLKITECPPDNFSVTFVLS